MYLKNYNDDDNTVTYSVLHLKTFWSAKGPLLITLGLCIHREMNT